MTLLIQFGSHPELSRAELASRVPECAQGRLIAGRFFYVETTCEPNWLMKELGGVVKILKIVGECDGQPDIEQLATHILSEISGKNKVTFGVSLINAPELAGIGLAIKRAIQTISERPVRHVVSREKELSSASVQLEKLLPPNGVELTILKDISRTIIAQTIIVQPFDEYSARDYDRPGRDARRGMLPPKLAKIMINLALGAEKPPSETTIYDPFCGSGTILTEAALLGCAHVMGSDISAAAVTDSQAALRWATEQFKLTNQIAIFKHDATSAAGHIKPRSVDCIVAETFLGRPLKKSEQWNEKEQLELVSLYNRALRALAPLLKPTGNMTLALPFQTKPQEFLPLNKILHGTPFKLTAEPLLYAREDQRTGRQVIQLKK